MGLMEVIWIGFVVKSHQGAGLLLFFLNGQGLDNIETRVGILGHFLVEYHPLCPNSSGSQDFQGIEIEIGSPF